MVIFIGIYNSTLEIDGYIICIWIAIWDAKSRDNLCRSRTRGFRPANPLQVNTNKMIEMYNGFI